MRTKGDCQAKGKRGRKLPCLGSKNTFIWAFYLFFLQTLGIHFNWKFSILQKMHLPCADCTTPDLGRDCDHKEHSSVTLLPCYTQVSSPKLFSPLPLREKIGQSCSAEGPGFRDTEAKSSSTCNPAFARQFHGAWQSMAKLSTMPYMEHKPCSCSSRTKTGLS